MNQNIDLNKITGTLGKEAYMSPIKDRKHTQTPWELGYKNDEYSKDELVIVGPPEMIDGEEMKEVICGTIMEDLNAQHIVKCVNSHDELVALLEESLIFLTDHNDLYRRIESALQSLGEEV